LSLIEHDKMHMPYKYIDIIVSMTYPQHKTAGILQAISLQVTKKYRILNSTICNCPIMHSTS